MYTLDKNQLPKVNRHKIDNKTVMVVSDDLICLKWIRTTLKNYGIKVILIDPKPNTFTQEDVHRYIQYDFTDHHQDEVHAERIFQTVSTYTFSIDGCCTFRDACGPLVAYLCEKLSLKGGCGLIGANNARNKSSVYTFLQKQTDGIYHFPRTYKYTAKSATISCEDTLRCAIKRVGLPAILKPEKGTNANGVMLIQNEVECGHLYSKLDSVLVNGNALMLMEYFDGTEHDIEVIIYEGEIIAVIVSDNGPTRPGCFVETSLSHPSCLHPSKVAQISTAASDCCIDIGLRNGVFNVEMKMTSTGPKLLEINGRMAGNYIRSYMYACYGIDLLWYVMAIASGIRPDIPPKTARAYVMGITCALPVHQHILSNTNFKIKVDELIESGEIQFSGQKYCDITELALENNIPFCRIAVVKPDLESAKSALLEVCDVLGIHTPLFDVPAYLSNFVSQK